MYVKKELPSFAETKEKYNILRESERKKIIKYLTSKELEVNSRGGMGKACYTNSNTLQRSYDLRNWKWIIVTVQDTEFLISLQAFDRDHGNGNYHVLMDRIGICSYPKTAKNPDYYKLMKITSLELPLDESDLEELCKLISE